jgi:hypothetical protein
MGCEQSRVNPKRDIQEDVSAGASLKVDGELLVIAFVQTAPVRA